MNWDGNKLESEHEKAVIFQSLVATVKFQSALDNSLEAKAVKFLECVDPRNEKSADAFLDSFASISDESLTAFAASPQTPPSPSLPSSLLPPSTSHTATQPHTRPPSLSPPSFHNSRCPTCHTLAHPSSLLPPSTSHTTTQPHTRPPTSKSQPASFLSLATTQDTDPPQNHRSPQVMTLRGDPHGSVRQALPTLPRITRTSETLTIL